MAYYAIRATIPNDQEQKSGVAGSERYRARNDGPESRSGIALQPSLQASPVLLYSPASIDCHSAAVGPVAQRGDGFGHHL